jgi:hypothetical protein
VRIYLIIVDFKVPEPLTRSFMRSKVLKFDFTVEAATWNYRESKVRV